VEPNWNPYMRETLLGMIGPTKKEAGYVPYDLHVDNDHPTHFPFSENWTSRLTLIRTSHHRIFRRVSRDRTSC